jgi:hypothetical protein
MSESSSAQGDQSIRKCPVIFESTIMTSRVEEESVISREEQLLTHSYEQVHNACSAYNHHDVVDPK